MKVSETKDVQQEEKVTLSSKMRWILVAWSGYPILRKVIKESLSGKRMNQRSLDFCHGGRPSNVVTPSGVLHKICIEFTIIREKYLHFVLCLIFQVLNQLEELLSDMKSKSDVSRLRQRRWHELPVGL